MVKISMYSTIHILTNNVNQGYNSNCRLGILFLVFCVLCLCSGLLTTFELWQDLDVKPRTLDYFMAVVIHLVNSLSLVLN